MQPVGLSSTLNWQWRAAHLIGSTLIYLSSLSFFTGFSLNACQSPCGNPLYSFIPYSENPPSLLDLNSFYVFICIFPHIRVAKSWNAHKWEGFMVGLGCFVIIVLLQWVYTLAIQSPCSASEEGSTRLRSALPNKLKRKRIFEWFWSTLIRCVSHLQGLWAIWLSLSSSWYQSAWLYKYPMSDL